LVYCVECVWECVFRWCGVWSGTGGVCSPVVVSVECVCVCVECVWWSVSGGVGGVCLSVWGHSCFCVCMYLWLRLSVCTDLQAFHLGAGSPSAPVFSAGVGQN